MDDCLNDNLVCPRDHACLQRSGDDLVCQAGHTYPVVDSIPVMLLDDVPPTHEVHARETFNQVAAYRMSSAPSPEEEQNHGAAIHPYVQRIVAAACGRLYRPLVGKLTRYPIPNLRMPPGDARLFLDIGCNWGRWAIAAAEKGYRPVGVDPSLEAVQAAREVTAQLGASRYVVADARYLPFASDQFDVAFSYSVLQHFSKPNVELAIREVARVLKHQGQALVQMPNRFGLKCLWNQVKRGFRKPRGFEVRFTWGPRKLRNTFAEIIGPTLLSVDGFFGLGIQSSDVDLLPWRYRLVVRSSEALRRIALKAGWMKLLADSVYVHSTCA